MSSKIGHIQISYDGWSKVSFKIINDKLKNDIKDVSISMVIELEGQTQEEFEEATGLSLYRFKSDEPLYVKGASTSNTSRAEISVNLDDFPDDDVADTVNDEENLDISSRASYLVEDYYVTISTTDPQSEAYYSDGILSLDVFENIALDAAGNARYNLLPFVEVKKAKFVFIKNENNKETVDYIYYMKYVENFFFETIENPFRSTPIITRVVELQQNKINTNRFYGLTKSEKDIIAKEFGGVDYGDLSSEYRNFRLKSGNTNQVVIFSFYNDEIPKSNYKLYINDKAHSVKRRIVSDDGELIAYIVNIKKKYAVNGVYSPRIVIENKTRIATSDEYRSRAIIVTPEDATSPPKTPDEGLVIDFTSNDDREKDPETGIDTPAIEVTAVGEVGIFGEATDLDTDPMTPQITGETSVVFVSKDGVSVAEVNESDLISEGVTPLIIDESSSNLIDITTLPTSLDDLIASLQIKKILKMKEDFKEDPCEEPGVSKKTPLSRIISFFDDTGEVLSLKKSNFVSRVISAKGSGSIRAFIRGGKSAESYQTISRMDGSRLTKMFFSIKVNSNTLSENPQLIKVNGKEDFSSISPADVRTVETSPGSGDLKLAINDVLVGTSSLSQNTSQVALSNNTQAYIDKVSDLGLPCESSISVVRPDKSIAETPDSPDIEDPCDKPPRLRGGFGIFDNPPSLSFINIDLNIPTEKLAHLQSVCDFSFYLTAELKIELKGFEKVLSVIKIIFCIIDVICSVTNPRKYFRALVRLFECLWDLISLLPQFAIPVMMIKMVIHILALLKCVFDKIAYYAFGLKELVDRAVIVMEKRDVQSLYQLEKTVEKYIASFEAEIDVLRPIEDIIAIFRRLLDLVFNLPCNLGNLDSVENIFCVDNIAASAVIAEKAETVGNLLMVAQTYTTEPPGKCGNTPSFQNSEEMGEFRNSGGDIKYKGSDCEDQWNTSDYKVIMKPEYSNGKKISETSKDYILDNVDNFSYRVKNSEFEGTFKISATKIIKASVVLNLDNIRDLKKDPARVYISFGNNLNLLGQPKEDINPKGITDEKAFGLFSFHKTKNISESDNIDDSLSLLNISGEEVLVGNSSSKDLFSAFGSDAITLSGGKQEGMHPSPLKYGFGSEIITYSNIPSFMIVDDEGDVYVIEENGMKFDDNGKIKGIFAKIISDTHAAKKTFEKEEEVSITKEGQDVLDAQANYEVVSSVLIEEEIAFSNSTHGRKEAPSEGYAEFIINKESLSISVSDLEDRMLYPEKGAYNFLGGSEEDVEEYQNSISLTEVFKFIDIYFVDTRSAGPELIESCESQVQNLDNLEAPSAEEVLDTVNALDDCMKGIRDYVYAGINKVKSDFQSGNISTSPFDVAEVFEKYKESNDCVEGILDSVCNQAVSSFSTSFKISEDKSVEPLDNILDPSGIPSSALGDIVNQAEEDIASADGVSFTGATEYASGIGDYIESSAEKSVKIVIIPRDIYDNTFSIDFSDRILIKIERDTTEAAVVSKMNYSADNSEHYCYISTTEMGEVDITASICGKSIKAFTYDGVSAEYSDENCTVMSTESLVSDLALGSVRTMKRSLTINFDSKNSEISDDFESNAENSSDTLKTGQDY